MKYRWDDFVLDLDAYRLERNGAPLTLEPKAIRLLALFVTRPGHAFSKQEIFDAVWPQTAVTDHALTRVVAQLRRVLGDEARDARFIETVPTRGYRWIPAVQREASPAPALSAQPAAQAEAQVPLPAHPGVRRMPLAYLAIAGALAIVLTLLGLAARGQRSVSADAGRAASTAPVWPVQVTTHSGLDLTPALSPQGDAVAYASDRSGSLEIYVRGLSGVSQDTALTSDAGGNVQPAWSPDGALIAYHSTRRGGIWVMPARGGAPRQLAPLGSDPEWSPDGRRLVFQLDEVSDVAPAAYGAQSGSTLWTVDVDGTNLRQVSSGVPPLGAHASPAWSHNGRWIAFTVFDGRDTGVWLLDVQGDKPKPLLRKSGLYEVAFAADDSAIYASAGEALIFRIPFDADSGTVRGDPELLPIPGVSSVRGMSVSADGRRLAFAGLTLSSQIWGLPVTGDGAPRGEAYAISSDTSRRNSFPGLSPDGSRIAYVSRRAGETPNIWVSNVDGTGAMQVTMSEGVNLRPFWLPDGTRIAFMGSRGGRTGLLAVDLTTRRERPLVESHREADAPLRLRDGAVVDMALSRSASQLALGVVVPPHSLRQLYVTAVDRFAPAPVTDGRTWIGYPAWSPDERQLAVEIKDGSSTHAGIVDTVTGEVRQLTHVRGHTWVRSWSPDGRFIAAAAMRDGRWRLEAIDVNTGGERVLLDGLPANVYVRYPDWSPRGDLMVFERGELRGNIWTLSLASDAGVVKATTSH